MTNVSTQERFIIMDHPTSPFYAMSINPVVVVMQLRYELIDRGKNYVPGNKSDDYIVGRYISLDVAQDRLEYLLTNVLEEKETK